MDINSESCVTGDGTVNADCQREIKTTKGKYARSGVDAYPSPVVSEIASPLLKYKKVDKIAQNKLGPADLKEFVKVKHAAQFSPQSVCRLAHVSMNIQICADQTFKSQLFTVIQSDNVIQIKIVSKVYYKQQKVFQCREICNTVFDDVTGFFLVAADNSGIDGEVQELLTKNVSLKDQSIVNSLACIEDIIVSQSVKLIADNGEQLNNQFDVVTFFRIKSQ
ncbi:hypothetical protein MP228_008522 [Amoeboaphelidium protococcarum]|nr:hypothetical protein MP228_008522 [Amoeboaphelidium protococcarum]